jgi:hypothetical protein
MAEIPEALSYARLLLHDQAELGCCQYQPLWIHAPEDMKSKMNLTKKSRQGEDKRTRVHEPRSKAEDLWIFFPQCPFIYVEPLLPIVRQDAEEYLSFKALYSWKPGHLASNSST